jgi:hypothetical protein
MTVRREGSSMHALLVTSQPSAKLAARGVPKADGVIAASSRHELAIGRECDGIDVIGVPQTGRPAANQRARRERVMVMIGTRPGLVFHSRYRGKEEKSKSHALFSDCRTLLDYPGTPHEWAVAGFELLFTWLYFG